MIYNCFVQSCEHEAQYLCHCLTFETHFCEFHLEAHLKLPNRTHSFDSILQKPYEWTKDEILRWLLKEKCNKEKIKQIVLTILSQNAYNTKENWETFFYKNFEENYEENSEESEEKGHQSYEQSYGSYERTNGSHEQSDENCFKESLGKFNSDLKEINSLIEKISQFPDDAQLLDALILQPDYKTPKTMIPKGSELYSTIKSFYRLHKLRYSTKWILNKVNNNPETEQYFKKLCKKYQNYTYNSLLNHAYQELINAYQKLTSHYFLECTYIYDRKIFIYNTELETETEQILKNAKFDASHKVFAQLPNGELFCWDTTYGRSRPIIIDKSYRSRALPRGNFIYEIGIYFNKSIYCFVSNPNNALPACSFDFDKNRWIILTSAPESLRFCNIILFKKNILISTRSNNILMYSTEIDTFLNNPYTFLGDMYKILLSVEDRLYLIEEVGCIYESEAGNEYSWTNIAKSQISFPLAHVQHLYNKRQIYILASSENDRFYFKFDLETKTIIDDAFYFDNIGFRKIGDKLEKIKIDEQNLKVDEDQYTAYFNKGFTLFSLYMRLKYIHENESKAKFNPAPDYKSRKEAYDIWSGLGYAFLDLNNDEALEYFNKALTLSPDDKLMNFWKGYALHELNRNFEALECYNEANQDSPNDYIYFCYRASLLNDLGKEEESIEDFNRAQGTIAGLTRKFLYDEILTKDCLELLEMLCKLQISVVEFKKELQNIKEISKQNQEIIGEIEKNEAINREQHSSLLKRAVRCLYEDNHKSIKDIQLIKSEISQRLEPAVASYGH